jgi:hypothetical protein
MPLDLFLAAMFVVAASFCCRGGSFGALAALLAPTGRWLFTMGRRPLENQDRCWVNA